MDTGAVVIPPYVGRPLRLAPFRGLRLTPRRVGDPASGRLFARPYRAVPGRLAQWQERGQLRHDGEPAVYLHEYTAAGLTVRGLVGALDISHRASGPEDRAVLPHEGIHPVQADELADRMTELALNPAPILLVHRAPASVRAVVHQVLATEPEDDFVDRNEQRHRVWAIRDPDLLATLDDGLATSQALIADGHHRYAAYLRMQRRHPGGANDRGLAMLVDQEDTPLFLGPIHRVLTGVGLDDLAAAAEVVGAGFDVVDRTAAVHALGPTTLAATDGRRWAVLKLHLPEERAAVEQLHEDLVPALPRGPQRIEYHHSVETTLDRLRRDSIAVLMPAPDVDLVHQIAADDRLLPEKATSFQPKPSVGVLIRSLRDG
ncbi:DUF1015 domain-containing protein [Nocardioides anomalus]|uniref:DUF1015 domain-containing protein n=1 Tax=Nocardioides anomalus TaxID=2712223 RepID=A0A6G6WE38_9ACTN|nr:DUF1015 family protein [Nocardioides anomalus]QIG43417.1 DUF1015 domain-containing protein [Nocardioides anomalus]